MKCPYCGIENPEDAQECSNCSADLASLPKGTPPPESLAPTMMTSSAEIAAMLAEARGESETEPEVAPEPVEPSPAESAPAPDYAAPTMITSGAEIAAMLSTAQAETPEMPVEEMSLEEVPMGEAPMDEPVEPSADLSVDDLGELPLEEVPMGEVPMGGMPVGDSSPYAPTMISSVPPEVADVIASAQAEKAAEEAAAPTFVGIPDPLGVTDSGETPAPEPTPVPPPPSYNEPVSAPTAPPPPIASTPEEPKDNRKMWIIGGVSCLVLCCLCSLVVVVVNLIPVIMQSF